MTLSDILHRAAERHPERPAFWDERRRLTYGELRSEVSRLAGALEALGVGPDKVVATSLLNCVEMVVAYFACAELGATITPCNVLLKEEELAYIYNDSQAQVVVAHNSLLPAVEGARPQSPSVRDVIVVGGEAPQAHRYDELVRSAAEREPLRRAREDGVHAILYTSGTTGRPKGAMLTHANIAFDAQATIEALGMSPEDVFLCVLPMFHSFAMTVCMVMPVMMGAAASVLERFSPLAVFETIARDRVTIFPAVPTMYVILLRTEGNFDLSSVRYCISGGAPMPVAVMQAFEQRFDVVVLEGDGPTECSPVTAVNRPTAVRKPASIGLPIPGVEIRIVDDNDRGVPTNEVGEIVVRGPNVMKGYLNRPEETAEAMRGGWFHTGDMGKIDEDGVVYIVDRKKDMIIVGGLNVYPREVEDILYGHPKVSQAAVIGVPDEVKGEAVRAVVQLKEGENATPEEIMEHCNRHLARYKAPTQIEFRATLPLTATGKVFKRTLREELH